MNSCKMIFQYLSHKFSFNHIEWLNAWKLWLHKHVVKLNARKLWLHQHVVWLNAWKFWLHTRKDWLNRYYVVLHFCTISATIERFIVSSTSVINGATTRKDRAWEKIRTWNGIFISLKKACRMTPGKSYHLRSHAPLFR